MPSPFVKSLLCSLVVYITYLFIKFRNRAIGTKKRKDLDFPKDQGWPIIGHLPEVLTNIDNTLELSTTKTLTWGPGWSITLPGIRLIDVSKPEWIEHIQKTNFDNYVKGSMFQNIMADVFGNGIFVSDGPTWKKTRHATSTIFNVNTFKTVMEPSIHRTLDSLVQSLHGAAQANQAVDLCDTFFKFTLESFVHMTFGVDLNLLSQNQVSANDPSPASSAFIESFDLVQNQLDFRFAMVTGWGIVEKFNTRLGKQMKDACNAIDEFAYGLIDQHQKPPEDVKSQENMSFQKDLLGLFMAARDERGGGLSSVELRDAALNLIIAGRDTTAQALSWGFYHLLLNKDIISKIREEAYQILNEGIDERVTYSNFKRFIWAHAAFLEALRLHPSVPKNVKFALKDDKIPGGPTIEAGNGVRWSDWAMSRNPDIWGPDCVEYKPERWIDELGRIKQFGPFKFHAFNGGPRICLGMNLAVFQGVSTIVQLFTKFEVDFFPGWLEHSPKGPIVGNIPAPYRTPRYKGSLTLPMAQPMMVTIRLR
ncbi:hypothetical protein O181_029347 [Austropuccinia psidii MF-1]|uniref:Cytochrome P450 n=1 Tax=Austropuccinia psidii MF-1 TaxID=1389203 RepID=A0A9Q3CWE3_9BASI|nr:hypothetical protein [Austropuccinia psidii MF-1]